MPVIGFLSSESPDLFAYLARAFREGLKGTGYVEGEDVAIEFRWADGQYDCLPALVADLIRRQVNVIAANSACDDRRVGSRSRTISMRFAIGERPPFLHSWSRTS